MGRREQVRTIGLLGGTFDPIHHGHLRLALEIRERLCLDELRLIPASLPPLREVPEGAAHLRLEMLRAALAGVPDLAVDERELHREGLSYTVDTLRSLREELPGHALCWVVGSDAFQRFDHWHEWQELPALAHICVASRPGSILPDAGELGEFVRAHRAADPSCLQREVAGRLLVCEIPALEISATYIRSLVRAGRNTRFLVPEPVRAIMETHGIYRDNQ